MQQRQQEGAMRKQGLQDVSCFAVQPPEARQQPKASSGVRTQHISASCLALAQYLHGLVACCPSPALHNHICASSPPAPYLPHALPTCTCSILSRSLSPRRCTRSLLCSSSRAGPAAPHGPSPPSVSYTRAASATLSCPKGHFPLPP